MSKNRRRVSLANTIARKPDPDPGPAPRRRLRTWEKVVRSIGILACYAVVLYLVAMGSEYAYAGYSEGGIEADAYVHVISCERQSFLVGGQFICDAPITVSPSAVPEIKEHGKYEKSREGLRDTDVGRDIPMEYQPGIRHGGTWHTVEARNAVGRHLLNVSIYAAVGLLLGGLWHATRPWRRDSGSHVRNPDTVPRARRVAVATIVALVPVGLLYSAIQGLNYSYSPGHAGADGFAHSIACKSWNFLDGGGTRCYGKIDVAPDSRMGSSGVDYVYGMDEQDIGRTVPVYFETNGQDPGWKTVEARGWIRNLLVPLSMIGLVAIFLAWLMAIWMLGKLRPVPKTEVSPAKDDEIEPASKVEKG